MSGVDDVLKAVEQVSTDSNGHMTVGASIGGQHVDLPLPVQLNQQQAQAVQDIHAIGSLLHQSIDHGHINPAGAVLALAYAISRGWLR
jgi:hypothetical protein